MRFWNLQAAMNRLSSDGADLQPSPRVRFKYVNWKGEPHTYEAEVESVEFGSYPGTVKDSGKEEPTWILHANVRSRDGLPRFGRRTFITQKIEGLEVIS